MHCKFDEDQDLGTNDPTRYSISLWRKNYEDSVLEQWITENSSLSLYAGRYLTATVEVDVQQEYTFRHAGKAISWIKMFPVRYTESCTSKVRVISLIPPPRTVGPPRSNYRTAM